MYYDLCQTLEQLQCFWYSVANSQCGKTRNFLSFEKYFVKATHSTQLTLTHFWQKFRESNGSTRLITKELIWRNVFGGKMIDLLSLKKYFVKSIIKTLFSRNFSQKSVTVNFRSFHTVIQCLTSPQFNVSNTWIP